MKKVEVTKNDVIHCETKEEFERLMDLFGLDTEFMDWRFYENYTVLYPLTNQYGSLKGDCVDSGLNVIKSTEIL